MGVCTEVHVGFYLQVKPQAIEIFREERVCGNDSAHPKPSRDASFCGLCGGAVITSRVPEKTELSTPEDLLSPEFEHLFIASSCDRNVWFPNFSIQTASGQQINKSFEVRLDPPPHEIDPAAIARWKIALAGDVNFKSAMDYLKEKYGDDSVSLKYGVVINHS